MDDIIAYYTDIFHLDRHVEPPSNIVTKLNMLDRAQRGELKARLFHEAKRLGVGGDGVKAIRWLESTFEQIERYSFRLHDVLFSPGQDIPENIAFYMAQAKQSIDLCVFTISDEKLGACLKRLHQRGVKIRLLTDNNKMRDVGSQVKELARAGISVKIDNSKYHMHNKFGIIDGRIAFTGSYNWTYTAKTYNQENLLLTTNFTIVHKFVDEFERLWGEMFWLRVKQLKSGQLKANVCIDGHNQEIQFSQDAAHDPDDIDDESSAEPDSAHKQKSKSWKSDRNARAKDGNGDWRPRDANANGSRPRRRR